MKAKPVNLSLSVLTLAVWGALATMTTMPVAASADDAATDADQINPSSVVEIGGIYTAKDSAKFGEYNGLDSKGLNLNADIDILGGDGYGQKGGTRRWSIVGTDLGLNSREISATVGDQGKWSLGIGFDQLRHHITDSFHMPYIGSVGGNTFTLPSAFGTINTSTTSPPGGQTVLTPTQLGAFHPQDVYSERQNTSLSAGFNIDRNWSLKFDWKHIDQSGSKLIAAASEETSLDGYTYSAERVAYILNPTESKTDNFNLALNWAGDTGYFSVGYYGSLYHDDYTSMSWESPFTNSTPAGTIPASGLPVNRMSTPPSNQFHQLNLSGGYFVTPETKLVGGLSYAHNKQDESYAGTYMAGSATPPVDSPNASVDIKHADLRVTHQATSALSLGAGYTYNERDNKTASYLYPFLTLGGDAASPASIPLSWKHHQADLSADYRISSAQHLHAGYRYDKYERWCDTSAALYAAGRAAPVDGSTPADATGCAQVPRETTNALALDYRLRANDRVTVKAGYAYSKRNSDINPNYYSPLQSFEEGYENMGYLAYFQASRKQNQFKAGVDWQATDKFDIGLSGKYAKDDYDVILGVQQGVSSSVNLDATYAYSENNSVNFYATTQHRTRDMTNGNGRLAGSLPTAEWTNNLTDDSLTLGLGAKQKGIMGGRMELSEDLSYALDKTDYSTGAGTGYTCTVTTSGSSTGNSTCGAFPTIRSEITTLKLTGSYKVDKQSTVALTYLYQHLSSTDPTYYDAFQYGFSSSRLPTGQVAPSYNQSVVFLAYEYKFR